MAQLNLEIADEVKQRLVNLAGPRNIGRYITKMLEEHDIHTTQIGSLKGLLESISHGQDRLEQLLRQQTQQTQQRKKVL